jgi:hypothetical protein
MSNTTTAKSTTREIPEGYLLDLMTGRLIKVSTAKATRKGYR